MAVNGFDAPELSMRAERARQILEDPIFEECVAAIEAEIIEDIASAEIGDPGAIQILALRLQAIRSLMRQLLTLMETGHNPDPETGKAFV